jgi:signal transduction histidine kinase
MRLLSRLLQSLGRRAPLADARVVDDLFRSLLLHAQPEPLYSSVLGRMAEIAASNTAALFLVDPETGDLRLQVARGGWPEALVSSRWPPDRGLSMWLSINDRPLLMSSDAAAVEDLPDRQTWLLQSSGAEVVVPLSAAGRLTGFLVFGPSARRDGWSHRLAHLIATLAVPAALAFEHAALVSEEQQRLRRLYRAERLATAGTLATGLAHEIRNPLTAIRSGIQLVRDRPDVPRDAAEILQDVINEVDRIDRLVGGLVMFARAPRTVFAEIDLGDVVRRSVALVRAQALKQGAAIELELPEHPVMISGDAGQLEQVILNLLLNALEAVPDQGRVEVVLATADDRDGTARVTLEIRDNGSGLTSEDRVFDPFFTTKPDGTGLGLPISYNIITQHRGELTLESRDQGGAVARVLLPGGEA